ncbi:MAG: hypothetical protein JST59_10365 [Actinobacteria bacterium]|nr:hypothetical protein [Actinomycetota bacterium]
MLAARNRRFRIAAAFAAAGWLLLAAMDLIEALNAFRETVPGGYDAAVVISLASHLVGAAGWSMVAGAFGAEIDWAWLWSGATVVATTYCVYFVSWVFRTFALLSDTHNGDYRGYYIATTIGTLIFAVGACVVATGPRGARAGTSRASRVQVGAALFAVASLALTIGALSLQSFYSSAGAVHEATIGTLLEAVGALLTGAAALVFTAGARRPLAVRERAVVGAGVVAVIAALCLVVGEGLIAYASSTRGGLGWLEAIAWLAVASRLALVGAFVAVALGARTVRDRSVLDAAGAA